MQSYDGNMQPAAPGSRLQSRLTSRPIAACRTQLVNFGTDQKGRHMDNKAPETLLKRERVRDYILELIEARRPGDAIPSERALSAELGVSRPTLRAAADDLVATGLLVREHGRGMFVAPQKITQELVSGQHSLSAPLAGGSWSSRLLEFATVQAGARVGRKLQLSPAASIVYIARLRLVDGAPIAIEHLHIPAELVPDLSEQELEAGDLYEHLRDHHQVQVHEAVQAIEPTVVTQAEAALLGVPELSPPCSSSGSPPTPEGTPSNTSTRSTAATATASSPGSPLVPRPQSPRRAANIIPASRQGFRTPRSHLLVHCRRCPVR